MTADILANMQYFGRRKRSLMNDICSLMQDFSSLVGDAGFHHNSSGLMLYQKSCDLKFKKDCK